MKQWWLLYKQDGFNKVWIYEQLFGKQLKRRLREGWTVVE